MATFETVILEKSNGLGTITLNRPERANTITRQLWADINAALDDVEEDASVRVLLITGAGDRHFCGGADLREHAQDLGNPNPRPMGRDFMTRFEELGQPVIAVINGAAMGGGCEIAAACDFRFMAHEAKIGVPEILFGLLPGGGGTQRLPRIVGMARAKEMVLTGRHYSAQEALAMGLVTGIAPRPALLATALGFARQLADLAPHAVKAGKMLVQRALDMDLATGLAFERRTVLTMATPGEMKAAQEQAMSSSSTYRALFGKA